MNIHLNQPVLTAGAPLDRCRAAAILIHGRGGAPVQMIDLARTLDVPGVAYIAPSAANQTWYPYRFIEPIARNQPYLDYALEAYQARVQEILAHGVPLRRLVLIGFSQGACLTAEYAVRYAARYGGIVAFTGGLIGPPGTTWRYPGRFDGTPVLFTGAEKDVWIPFWRMRESVEVFSQMGAQIETHFYPGSSHEITESECVAARTILYKVIEEVGR
ncbi:MAG: dienelactone hydrolase family protein [Roseiflexus sp.]|nr:dienelactone hydrolase family protein [Roseiflexus sp.]